MRRLSKFCAGALAVMLSAVLVLPITASAKQYHDYTTSASDIIDEISKKEIVSGSDTSTVEYGYSSDKARVAAWEAAVAKKIAVKSTIQNYDETFSVWDDAQQKSVDYYYKLTSENWRYDDDYDNGEISKDKKTYTYFLTFYNVTYKNNVTGETSGNRNDLQDGLIVNGVNFVPKKWTVYTGNYSDVTIKLTAGNVKIKNLKSSKKKVIQARVSGSDVEETSAYYDIYKDSKGYYYISDATYDRVYVNGPDDKISKTGAEITIRVFGKKAGKATISFDIYDVNNKKKGTGKITVISSKNKPIESITFGGKNLDQGDVIGKNNSKYIYDKKDINTFYQYTTAKSGKLKVTPNSNYKLVRIQVGKLEKYTWSSKNNDPNYDASNYSTSEVDSVSKKTIETTDTHPVDLNGDGDFDDTINGIYEGHVTYKYTTVKNNKKVTLSKVGLYTQTTTEDKVTYKDPNRKADNYYNKTTKGNKDEVNVAPTKIKVTLYNRTTKDYVDVNYVIYKRIKNF